jgi:hypothetical protein
VCLPAADPARKGGVKWTGSTLSWTLLAEAFVGRVNRERTSLLGAGAGGLLATASVFLTVRLGDLAILRGRSGIRLRLAGDREVLMFPATEGGLASSSDNFPCLAAQDAVGAKAEPLREAGLVVSFGSDLGASFWIVAAGFLVVVELTCRGFGATTFAVVEEAEAGLDSSGLGLEVVPLRETAEGFLIIAIFLVFLGDGIGDSTFEPLFVGTARFFVPADFEALDTLGSAFFVAPCLASFFSLGFSAFSLGWSTFSSGPAVFLTSSGSSFLGGGAFSARVGDRGAVFTTSAVFPSDEADALPDFGSSDLLLGTDRVFSGGSSDGAGFSKTTLIFTISSAKEEMGGPGSKGPETTFSGEAGTFCKPRPVCPSLPGIATNEVRTLPKGLGPGLDSRVLGADLGEAGAGEPPFSNLARRFLTVDPAIGYKRSGVDGVLPPSNLEMMADIASEPQLLVPLAVRGSWTDTIFVVHELSAK